MDTYSLQATSYRQSWVSVQQQRGRLQTEKQTVGRETYKYADITQAESRKDRKAKRAEKTQGQIDRQIDDHEQGAKRLKDWTSET